MAVEINLPGALTNASSAFDIDASSMCRVTGVRARCIANKCIICALSHTDLELSRMHPRGRSCRKTLRIEKKFSADAVDVWRTVAMTLHFP